MGVVVWGPWVPVLCGRGLVAGMNLLLRAVVDGAPVEKFPIIVVGALYRWAEGHWEQPTKRSGGDPVALGKCSYGTRYGSSDSHRGIFGRLMGRWGPEWPVDASVYACQWISPSRSDGIAHRGVVELAPWQGYLH